MTPRRRACRAISAQQPRSNSALRTRTSHHAPALPLWWNALLREGLWRVPCRGSLDGMQGVRGSNPLSSTPIYQRKRPGQLPEQLGQPQQNPNLSAGKPATRGFEFVGTQLAI